MHSIKGATPNICQQLNMIYAPPLMARGAAACATQSRVRRLTPTECERLQGLPDSFTAGGSDAKRYKALGNGLALPCAEYVLRRITEIIRKETEQ